MASRILLTVVKHKHSSLLVNDLKVDARYEANVIRNKYNELFMAGVFKRRCQQFLGISWFLIFLLPNESSSMQSLTLAIVVTSWTSYRTWRRD
ncbi:hypothetical protein IGI04_036561 [Brassica rapa subsp. trilocularis]|uniref:Uncharacterized protein n=1 Tax=Brassica rapa subsp. trilocularis TaxID=1813537 RepID=A0ABQ7LH32_BRACM|nr:hypothetical protein IGI04_036561 [Brassica rapa subsp. trilocularis]